MFRDVDMSRVDTSHDVGMSCVVDALSAVDPPWPLGTSGQCTLPGKESGKGNGS